MKTIKNINGFTLIELMIVVIIVGVLAAISLPAYQNYTIRSQISEGIVLAEGVKPIIGEYFSNNGFYPQTNDTLDFKGATGKYVNRTDIVQEGKIIATFGNQVNSKILGQNIRLVPKTESTGNISWSCESSIPQKLLPISCLSKDDDSMKNTYFNSTFQMINGKLYKDGNPLTFVSQDKDGLLTYKDNDGVKSTFNKEGTATIEWSDGTSMSYYTDSSVYQNYKLPDGTIIEQSFFDGSGYDKLWSNGYGDIAMANDALGAAFRQLTSDNSTENKLAYDNTLNDLKNKLNIINLNNGGKFPNNIPKSLEQIFNKK